MVTPADLLGAQKLAVGKLGSTLLKDLLDILYGTSGALTGDQLSAKLTELQSKVSSNEEKDQFKRVMHLYKTGAACDAFGDGPFMAKGDDGKTIINKVTFEQIIGKRTELPPEKSMSVILCNSAFLSPPVRNAERVEMFMNFLPTIVASRLVPFLEVDFAFHRVIPDNKAAQPHMWSPSLTRFLLGGDSSAIQDSSSPTAKMLQLRENQTAASDKDKQVELHLNSTAGMELFTAPQLAVNNSPTANAGRYVNVLDPMRPFMSVESFNVNVTPTVGLYSFKKASLVLKLHDRSRLTEISDLIRPQVYQDAGSSPTVWITYGWRHLAENGNPYAEFINGNMLVREAYKVMNSQFAFDAVGQVTVTVELFTQGLPEMRVTNINDDGSLQVVKEIQNLAQQIQNNRIASGLGSLEGVNKEIRPLMILESAEHGTFPADLSDKDITDSLASLKKSLNSQGAKLDQSALKALLAALDKFYNPNDKDYLDYKNKLKSQASQRTNARFSDVMTGADPFLPFTEKNDKKADQSKSVPHALTSLVEALNEYSGESEIKELSNPTNKKIEGFRKKAVSFGKLVTAFTAGAFKIIDGLDEMQLYFYQFNDQAGACRGENIADFPIDMPVFLDHYREHVERKGSERVTLEEFLQLVIDSQLHDIRSIGYGMRSQYAPYDPAHKSDVNTRKGIKPEEIELSRGPFRMPAIAVYVETVHASGSGTDALDKLHQYESPGQLPGDPAATRSSDYVRIMRIHIFDKANSPYKLAETILSADNGLSFAEFDSEVVKQAAKDKKDLAATWSPVIGGLTPDGKLDPSKGVNNQKVKEYVSKMIPTIVYGGNASSVISANLASKQDALLATTQMQAQAKGSGKQQTLQANGSDVGGLPLRIIPASMTMTTLGCPLLTYGQQFFVDFNTGTTVDNVYLVTGLTHTITPGKFESQMTMTFYDAYGKFFGAPTITEYVKSMQVPEAKGNK